MKLQVTLILTLLIISTKAHSYCSQYYKIHIQPSYKGIKEKIYEKIVDKNIETANLVYKNNGICLQLIKLPMIKLELTSNTTEDNLREMINNRFQIGNQKELILINMHINKFKSESKILGLAYILNSLDKYRNNNYYNFIINAELNDESSFRKKYLYNNVTTHEIGHLFGLNHNNHQFITNINNENIVYTTIMNSKINSSYAFASPHVLVNDQYMVDKNGFFYNDIDEIQIINNRLDNLYDLGKIDILYNDKCCIKEFIKHQVRGGYALLPIRFLQESQDIKELFNDREYSFDEIAGTFDHIYDYILHIKNPH